MHVSMEEHIFVTVNGLRVKTQNKEKKPPKNRTICIVDELLISKNPDKKNEIPGKNLLKVVKFQNLVEKCSMCGQYSLKKFVKFLIIVLRAGIVTTFGSKMVTISACT